MYSLIALKKLHDGTIDLSNTRDVAKVAPFLLSVARKASPAIIDTLFWHNVNTSPDPQEYYWHWLDKIMETQFAGENDEWILNQFENVKFDFLSNDTVEQRREEIAACEKIPNSSPQLKLPYKSTLYSNIFNILHANAYLNQRPTAIRAAQIIFEKFKDEFQDDRADKTKKTLRNKWLTLGGNSFSEWDLTEPGTLERIQNYIGLANEIDQILGTENSHYEIIKSLFVPSFLSTTDKSIRNFIQLLADELPAEEKKSIIQNRWSYLKVNDNGPKALCKSTGWGTDANLLRYHDRQALDDFLACLKKWDDEIDGSDLLIRFMEEAIGENIRQEKDNKVIYLSHHTLESNFHPAITWNDLSERIDTALKILGFDHRVSLDNEEYIQACFYRSFEYGHIQDAQMIADYVRNLSPNEREEYYLDEKTGLPRSSRSRIARIPEIIELYCSLYPKEALQNWTTYNASPLQKLKIFLRPNSDHDKFNYDRCSYYRAGVPLAQHEITHSFPTVLKLIEENLPEEEQQKNIAINEILQSRDFLSNFNVFHEICDKESTKALLTFIDKHNFRKIDSKLEYSGYMLSNIRYIIDLLTELKNENSDIFHQLLIDTIRWADNSFDKITLIASYFHDDAPHLKQFFEQPAFKMFREKLDKILAAPAQADEAEISIYELYYPCRDHFLGAPELCASDKLMEEILPIAKIIQKIEGNDAAGDNSRKLAKLFTNYQKAATFVERHTQPGRQPLHDLCLFTVTQKPFNKEIWENLAIRYGGGATRYLSFADKIEKYIEQFNERRRALNISFGKKGNDIQKGMIDLRQLKPYKIGMIASRVAYEGADQNRDIADFCLHHGASEEGFQETVRLVEEFNAAAKPVTDNTPNIRIDGTNIGLSGYAMQKVAKGDLINLWVGKLVNCCNHLDYAGRDMAKAQFSGPDNALYVIFDRHQKPVAKFSGWMSEKGNLVFNAWERLSPAHDFLMSRFALAASLQVLEDNPSIKRVTMGAGPIKKDSVPFKFLKEELAEKAAEHVGKTYDSNEQFLIASRGDIGVGRSLLQKFIADNQKRGEVTIKLTSAERRALNAA